MNLDASDHGSDGWWTDAPRFMVAADHGEASRAGAEILHRGGNAVDAAVATSFALSVVRPQSCGLGGGGFMLIHRPGHAPTAVDFRESAPAAAERRFYLDDRGHPIPRKTVHGAWSVAVPSQVRGLLYVLERYGSGRVGRAEIIAPALRLARTPLVVDRHMRRASVELEEDARRDAGYLREYAELYRCFTNAGKARAIGESIDRSALASTLEAVARDGDDGFYKGRIADAMIAEVKQRGGPLTHADLADYRVREFEPLHGRFGDCDVLAMPPPSSGGAVIVQVMNVLALLAGDAAGGRETVERGDVDPALRAHRLVEAFKHAYADRARWLGDRDEAVLGDVARMISAARAREVAAAFDSQRTREPNDCGMRRLPEDGGTSHFCVVDGEGMAASATDTVNLTFGSYLLVPGTGIILNNEMDDFAIDPETPNAFGLRESERNLLRPGRRPLSSMAPVIVLRDGRAELVAGGSGGPRIISATLQVMLNVLAGGMALDAAVAAPRVHHQWTPDEVWMQRGIGPAIITGLLDRGHRVRYYPGTAGHVQAIARTVGGWRGACDPDKQGQPVGG